MHLPGLPAPGLVSSSQSFIDRLWSTAVFPAPDAAGGLKRTTDCPGSSFHLFGRSNAFEVGSVAASPCSDNDLAFTRPLPDCQKHPNNPTLTMGEKAPCKPRATEHVDSKEIGSWLSVDDDSRWLRRHVPSEARA